MLDVVHARRERALVEGDDAARHLVRGQAAIAEDELITGMLMLGKMSVGVRRADATPTIMISSAMTTKVYGRRSASLTMPITASSLAWQRCGWPWPPARPGRRRPPASPRWAIRGLP